MGKKLGTHRSSFAGIGWTIYVGGIALLAAPANLFGVGSQGQVSPFSERLSMAGICLVVGVLLLLPALMRMKQVVEVFERGLVWQRLFGTKTINSADVQSVKHIQHTGRNGNYQEIELQLKDGSSHSINGIKEADQLVAYIRAWGRVAAAPAAAPAYAAPAVGGWRPPGT
ncbi:MAG TPA: hypothetical protein VHB79_05510 [Polyangiaceae bacterium]|nr:hypothetical protein [Polyangiaceae bacterium]